MQLSLANVSGFLAWGGLPCNWKWSYRVIQQSASAVRAQATIFYIMYRVSDHFESEFLLELLISAGHTRPHAKSLLGCPLSLNFVIQYNIDTNHGNGRKPGSFTFARKYYAEGSGHHGPLLLYPRNCWLRSARQFSTGHHSSLFFLLFVGDYFEVGFQHHRLTFDLIQNFCSFSPKLKNY